MRALAVVWGLGGFLALIASACCRLTPKAMEAFRFELGPVHYAVLIAWVGFMVYSEAYKGFHRAFAPRFAARLKHLRTHATPVQAIFAPFFAMALFHSTPRRKFVAWALVIGITCLVLLLHHVPQPWRGIVDTGVVLGLALGTASVVYFTRRAFTDASFPYSPDLPE